MGVERGLSAGLGGIIVAAGRSSRMGRPKALLEIGGRVVLDRLVAVYHSAGLSPVVVVASGPTLAAARAIDRIVVVQGDPDQPMIDSLARGIEALPAVAEGAVVQPADAPYTTREMIAALIESAPGVRRAAAVLAHQGTPGHPVLIFRSAFDAIRARPEGGLRGILERLVAERIEHGDRRLLADLDTAEDLALWEASGSTGPRG